MIAARNPAFYSAFQLKLKQLCIDVETLFECRGNRFAFARDTFFAAALFYVVFDAQATWLPGKPWPWWAASWLVFAWAIFWSILHMVRRFHDLGRTGSLFWAIAIPFWAAWRIGKLFHLSEKPDMQWMWIVLGALCLWSIWLALQLFFKRGTEGPNGYEAR